FKLALELAFSMLSFDSQLQQLQLDAHAPELSILLHGMLFTNIQLDNFLPTLAHFLECIEIEGAEEHEWIMMTVVNISAMLEYGRPSGMLCKIGGVGAHDTGTGVPAVKVAKKYQVTPAFRDEDGEEKWMDVDDKGTQQTSPALSDANIPMELPVSFKLVLELAFSMLSFVLHN
ncbi:uncharacterized protein EDB93DRAFT_1069242, partial [Suillus bovinus]|uniref:uncharacterized protein n=1 Tax=Suillus bovinus TaxID=48563 RepID=UPI001B87E2F6